MNSTRTTAALIVMLTASCTYTGDPDYPAMPMGRESFPPWDAPQYTASQLAAYFAGADYASLRSVYVGLTGSDAAGDGSRQRPYRTVGRAVEADGTPGTIIRVSAGTYAERVVVAAVATRARPLVLLSEDGPGKAKIDGAGKDETIVEITGRHVVLDGFEIHGTRGYGVQIGPADTDAIGGSDSFCVVRNNVVHHTGRDAVKCSRVNFVLIEGNDISRVQHVRQNDNGIDGVAVYHSLCRHNYIHDNGPGIGGYFKGGSSNNIWHSNRFQNIGAATGGVGKGACLQPGGHGSLSWRDHAWFDYPSGYGQVAYNNLFVNCGLAAVLLTSAKQSKIYNNSIYNCGFMKHTKASPRSLILTVSPNNVSSAEIAIFNNVAHSDAAHPFDRVFNDAADPVGAGGVTHGHNTVYAAGGAITWGYPDHASASEAIADPLYAAPDKGDLSLAAGSPAVDSGIKLDLVSVDYAGAPRPRGAGVDRGAYER